MIASSSWSKKAPFAAREKGLNIQTPFLWPGYNVFLSQSEYLSFFDNSEEDEKNITIRSLTVITHECPYQ
jgi:hypothetical protein